MKRIEIPIIPCLSKRLRHSLWAWLIVKRFDVEALNGAGKISKTAFFKWAREHGWTRPDRIIKRLFERPLALASWNLKAEDIFYLKGLKQIVYILSRYASAQSSEPITNIFTAVESIHDGFSIPDLNRFWVRSIAGLPLWHSTKSRRFRRRYQKPSSFNGRSLKTIARMADVSVQTVINHTRDLAVSHYEEIDLPIDKYEKASAELNAAGKVWYIIRGSKAFIIRPNTYRVDTFFKRRILLQNSHDGQCCVRKTVKARFGVGWWIDDGQESVVIHEASPEMKLLFSGCL